MIVFDGWWWPEGGELLTSQGGVPPILETEARGGATVRYPDPASPPMFELICALRDSAAAIRNRPVADIIAAVGGVGQRFLDDPEVAEEAVGAVFATTGHSLPMARRLVEAMALDWTRPALRRLVSCEFPDPSVLDRWVKDKDSERWIRAMGDDLIVHIGAGSVPGVTTTSMIRALLVKSPSLVKPGLGDVALPVLFARILGETDPELGQSLAVSYWPGGHDAESSIVAEARRAVVYGDDDTIEAVRRQVPASVSLVEHGARLGVAVVDGTLGMADSSATAGVVDPSKPSASAYELAEAVAPFDQRGCVSPHLVFWKGSKEDAVVWGGQLAWELERLEGELPPSATTMGEAATLHQLRGALLARQVVGEGVTVFSEADQGWTVVVSTDISSFVPRGGRFLWICPVETSAEILIHMNTFGPTLQSVGLWGFSDDKELLDGLLALGATRLVPLSDLAFPPAEWLHDGNRPLGELVRWRERRL